MMTEVDMCHALAKQYHADFVAIKDENSHYIAANNSFLSFLGLSDIDDLYDKTDYELPYANFAEQYVANDMEAMMTGSLLVFEPTVNAAGESMLALSHKYPFTHPVTYISGSLCIVKMIHSLPTAKSVALLKNYDVSQLKVSDTLFAGKINGLAKIPLTERELDVLYYILHGLSQKQVAYKLNLSIRTIEDYVEHVKYKLNCGNKHQLFEFAVNNKLINIIPRHLLS